jgi:hypothetical protein
MVKLVTIEPQEEKKEQPTHIGDAADLFARFTREAPVLKIVSQDEITEIIPDEE